MSELDESIDICRTIFTSFKTSVTYMCMFFRASERAQAFSWLLQFARIGIAKWYALIAKSCSHRQRREVTLETLIYEGLQNPAVYI